VTTSCQCQTSWHQPHAKTIRCWAQNHTNSIRCTVMNMSRSSHDEARTQVELDPATAAGGAAAASYLQLPLTPAPAIAMYQCRQCRTIIADSTNLLAELGDRLVFEVAHHVQSSTDRSDWRSAMNPASRHAASSMHHVAMPLDDGSSDELEFELGVMYTLLHCDHCSTVIGKIWQTAPAPGVGKDLLTRTGAATSTSSTVRMDVKLEECSHKFILDRSRLLDELYIVGGSGSKYRSAAAAQRQRQMHQQNRINGESTHNGTGNDGAQPGEGGEDEEEPIVASAFSQLMQFACVQIDRNTSFQQQIDELRHDITHLTAYVEGADEASMQMPIVEDSSHMNGASPSVPVTASKRKSKSGTAKVTSRKSRTASNGTGGHPYSASPSPSPSPSSSRSPSSSPIPSASARSNSRTHTHTHTHTPTTPSSFAKTSTPSPSPMMVRLMAEEEDIGEDDDDDEEDEDYDDDGPRGSSRPLLSSSSSSSRPSSSGSKRRSGKKSDSSEAVHIPAVKRRKTASTPNSSSSPSIATPSITQPLTAADTASLPWYERHRLHRQQQQQQTALAAQTQKTSRRHR